MLSASSHSYHAEHADASGYLIDGSTTGEAAGSVFWEGLPFSFRLIIGLFLMGGTWGPHSLGILARKFSIQCHGPYEIGLAPH